MLTLVASALAGGDCIDDDVLRTGGGACAPGCVLKAPSTLGAFLPSFRQTGPLSHGRPLLMAVRGVESNISNLPTRGAQTASVSGGLFISVRRGVPSGGAAGVLPVQGRADGVGQSVLAPSNTGVEGHRAVRVFDDVRGGRSTGQELHPHRRRRRGGGPRGCTAPPGPARWGRGDRSGHACRSRRPGGRHHSRAGLRR